MLFFHLNFDTGDYRKLSNRFWSFFRYVQKLFAFDRIFKFLTLVQQMCLKHIKKVHLNIFTHRVYLLMLNYILFPGICYWLTTTLTRFLAKKEYLTRHFWRGIQEYNIIFFVIFLKLLYLQSKMSTERGIIKYNI